MTLLPHTMYILLADDDIDDRMLFEEILEELSFSAGFITVKNGELLMQLLNDIKDDQLPGLLFLDLNLPRKNGFECLAEIRKMGKIKMLPVVIITTSNEPELINQLYNTGAQYYIRKPNNYGQLKKVIHKAIELIMQTGISQPPREKFVLS